MRLQITKCVVIIVLFLLIILIAWNSKQMEPWLHISEGFRQVDNEDLWLTKNYFLKSEAGTEKRDGISPLEDLGDDDDKDLQSDVYFRYQPPPKSEVDTIGKPFTIPDYVAKDISELSKFFIELNQDTMPQFVCAMAASENHFNESIDGVASVQFNFPGKPIFYYDLGLTEAQVKQIKTWKYVHYRVFNFSQYPEHFAKNLRMCGWKPFIVKEVLRETGGVLWMDASARIRSKDFSAVYEQILDNDGLILFKMTGHSNYAATHSTTYDFLPTRQANQKKTYMDCAAAMLIYNTRAMFYNVLWWWFLCAYEESCQMPMRKTQCKFDPKRRMQTFADCHKWDQSTINVLLSNYHGYNISKYTLKEYSTVTIERWPTYYYDIQVN